MSCCLVYCIAVDISTGYAQADHKLSVSNLRQEHVSGSGCFLSNIKEKNRDHVFEAQIPPEAWMNINGNDVLLKETAPEQKKGKRTVWQYRADDISVRVELSTTKRFPDGEEVKGTITVSRGKQRVVIKVSGGCGC